MHSACHAHASSTDTWRCMRADCVVQCLRARPLSADTVPGAFTCEVTWHRKVGVFKAY